MQLFDLNEVKYIERDTNSPTLSGVIQSEIGKGGTIIITLGDKTYTTEINKQDGKWSWTPPEGLNDGHYSLSIVVRDKAGNISPPALRTLIIDTTPPEAPQLLYIYDDQGKETGMIHPGDKTDDRRPTLTGVAQKGTIVYLKDGDKIIGSAKADEKTGVWTIEPEQDLSDGPHKLTLVAKETFAGKERWGDETQAIDIIIGDDAPGVPVIGSVIDDVGTITGNISNGGVTDDKRPTLTGTADANSIVTLFVDGKAAGSVRADSTGHWSLTPLADLADGLHKLTVTASDDKGNSSIETASWDITVDTVIDTPTITRIHDNYGSKTGDIPNGGKTDDLRPDLFGKAEPGSVVKIYNGDKVLGSVTADDKGDWKWEPNMSGVELAYGTYNFSVTATDKAGNVSGKSGEWKVDIGKDLVASSGKENFENAPYSVDGPYTYASGFQILEGKASLYANDNFWLALSSRKLTCGFEDGTTDMQFSILSGQYSGAATLSVAVYDTKNNLLYKESFSLNYYSPKLFKYTAPEGVLIGSFKMEGGAGSVGIDNVIWGTNADGYNQKPEATFIQDDMKLMDDQALVFLSENKSILKIADLKNNLNLEQLMDKGAKDLFIQDGFEQVLVQGTTDDKITLSDLLKDGTDLGDWKQEAGTVTIAGEQYNVYQHSGSDVEVLVQMGVQVELQNH